MADQDVGEEIVKLYRSLVQEKYPDRVAVWPVLSGYDLKRGLLAAHPVLLFVATGNSGVRTTVGLGELDERLLGGNSIDGHPAREAIRRSLEQHFQLGPRDAIIILERDGRLHATELEAALRKHESALGLAPMRIFLSHKGADKAFVTEYFKTLQLLGFAPWLDDEDMAAGTNLERGLLNGFKDSCAAVFFVTKNFIDENYLATEVNYAVSQKREKGDRFSIITLTFDGADKNHVPELLQQYVWKSPQGDLHALREIIRALPVEVGRPYWRTL